MPTLRPCLFVLNIFQRTPFFFLLFLISCSSVSPRLCPLCVCGCASDMTGAQDGSVRMFEWNRPQQLICFRQAGNARVTRLYFNSQGNKVHTHSVNSYVLSMECSFTDCSVFFLQCGVADGEGFLSLWQVNQTSSNPKPYLVRSPATPTTPPSAHKT